MIKISELGTDMGLYGLKGNYQTSNTVCQNVLFVLSFLTTSDTWLVSSASEYQIDIDIWTASSEFGTYRLCEQRRFRRACASAQSRQNLRCSLIQAVSQEEPSDMKPDPWPL